MELSCHYEGTKTKGHELLSIVQEKKCSTIPCIPWKVEALLSSSFKLRIWELWRLEKLRPVGDKVKVPLKMMVHLMWSEWLFLVIKHLEVYSKFPVCFSENRIWIQGPAVDFRLFTKQKKPFLLSHIFLLQWHLTVHHKEVSTMIEKQAWKIK